MLLAINSPVFHAMFFGSFKGAKTIEVTDISIAAFRAMLKYLYSEQLNITSDNVHELLLVAQKYEINHMVLLCFRFFHNTVTVSNIIQSLLTRPTWMREDPFYAEFLATNADDVLKVIDTLTRSKTCIYYILTHLLTYAHRRRASASFPSDAS